jgi:hypothetical protein
VHCVRRNLKPISIKRDLLAKDIPFFDIIPGIHTQIYFLRTNLNWPDIRFSEKIKKLNSLNIRSTKDKGPGHYIY